MEVSLYSASLHTLVSHSSLKMLHDMKKQFVGLLHDIGFVCSNDPKEAMANVNSGLFHYTPLCLYILLLILSG